MEILSTPRLQIRWKGLEKDPIIENYFINRCSKIYDFNFVNNSCLVKAEVVFYSKNNNFKASLTVAIKGKPDVRAESTLNHVLQQAINEAVEKVLDQLRRIKTQYSHK